MSINLDALKEEIEQHLAEHGVNVFHGYSRLLDSLPIIYWDVEHHPDFRAFLQVARNADAKILVFHQREFTPDHIEDALERLESGEIPADERRSMERRLKELRVYEGFTCAIELSFDHEGRIYVYDVRSEWYEELSDILEDISAYTNDVDEDDEGPISGYFSQN
ncbi:MAG TPA: hypothetical protein VFA04_02190 [Bryobacteraceae bacterium]|nr:hypothetical protein [Bryobacteraceae bacterium]